MSLLCHKPKPDDEDEQSKSREQSLRPHVFMTSALISEEIVTFIDRIKAHISHLLPASMSFIIVLGGHDIIEPSVNLPPPAHVQRRAKYSFKQEPSAHLTYLIRKRRQSYCPRFWSVFSNLLYTNIVLFSFWIALRLSLVWRLIQLQKRKVRLTRFAIF